MAIEASSYGAICCKRICGPVARAQNNNLVISDCYRSYMLQVMQSEPGSNCKIYVCQKVLPFFGLTACDDSV